MHVSKEVHGLVVVHAWPHAVRDLSVQTIEMVAVTSGAISEPLQLDYPLAIIGDSPVRAGFGSASAFRTKGNMIRHRDC